MRPDRIFRSRMDAWLLLLVASAAAAPLAASLWLAWHGSMRGVPLLAGWGAVMVLGLGLLGLPVRYTFRPEHLAIRSGILRWIVPYSTLRHASPTFSPLSAPAWSLRRIRLECAGGFFILVSPDDRKQFMEELAGRCPHLAWSGPGLQFRPPL